MSSTVTLTAGRDRAGSVQTPVVSAARLAAAVDQLLQIDRPRFRRLWAYYRNPMRPLDSLGEDKPYRQAQEWGLPSRITGFRSNSDVTSSQRIEDVSRKEVVIENDIGWRVETLVEYLFGKSLVIASAAPDPVRREQISDLLRQMLAANGGMLLLQQVALLASVYGFVDVLVKLDPVRLREALDAKDAEQDFPAVHRNVAPSAAREGASGGASGVASDDVSACGETQSLGRPPVDSINDASELSADPTVGSLDGAHVRDASRTSQAEPAARFDAPATASPASTDASAVKAPSLTAAAPSIDSSPQAHHHRLCAEAISRLARLVRFEMIEPARALPLLSSDDYRVVEAYGQVFETITSDSKPIAKPPGGFDHENPVAQQPAWIDRLYRAAKQKLRPPLISFSGARNLRTVQVIELLTSDKWQRYEDGRLVASGCNSLGIIPLVHIQNAAVPFEYGGASDVEPLIPLQDELNTRLSDRAHRITMQSFKMYLGKGIEDFTSMPVAPGRMWATDNPDAQVIEFGGDSANPSEESHIAELREAMDKTSGVSPVAAGGVKNKLGHLTSAAALRVTMQSLLSKTEKKRITFGMAISRMFELALAWLDAAGVFATTPDERRIELHWQYPLPISDTDALDEAQAKLKLGIPAEVVTRELGY